MAGRTQSEVNVSKSLQLLYSSGTFIDLDANQDVVVSGIRGVYIGGAGDLTVEDSTETEYTFTGLQAGEILSISPTKVISATTTATNIIGFK